MSTAKTEAPTPQRLRELRKKGEVPISRELNRTAALVGALVALAATGPAAVRQLFEFTAAALGGGLEPVDAALGAGALFVRAALPVAGAAALAAATMGGLQTGLVFAPGRILPEAQRFAPGQAWASRLRVDTVVDAVVALTAAVLGGAAAAFGVWDIARSAPAMVELGRSAGVAPVASVALDRAAVVGAAWLGIAAVVAGIDAAWQRQAFLRRHRMSLQEIRDEYKQAEGDPQHKARRARAHRELMTGSVKEGVARADVIVTNPVRIAVGLRYRPDEVDAPTVTVVGRGDAARAIRREATRARVPEYMDREVARAVVDLEVGDTVPESIFEPVAVVFRWVRELESARGR